MTSTQVSRIHTLGLINWQVVRGDAKFGRTQPLIGLSLAGDPPLGSCDTTRPD